jgi:long-chain acyl-CoA synthetase
VLESACVGIPDAVLGEVVKAFVVKREGASCEVDEVKKYVMTQLEGYKVPAEVAFIESLPKTASGKLQRLMLKEM